MNFDYLYFLLKKKEIHKKTNKNLSNTYFLLLLGKLTKFLLLKNKLQTKQKRNIFHCYPVKLLTNRYKTISKKRLSS